MNDISEEIFNILKGANYKLRLFTKEGEKTMDTDSATRFYAYDQDLMVSIREEDDSIEVVCQAGADYDVPGNSELLKSIRKVAHKNLGEFTVRKFNKSIAPKDFAHQSVTEAQAFGKGFGSIKTSYIAAPNNAKITIKHNAKVNEEKRGARSRNIQSIFIENSQGERFNFPYKNVPGAKAMAKHVSEGNTPYDEKGQAILSMCEELANINQFVKHVRGNKLMNENNEDVVLTIREAASKIKETIKSLSTNKGYNNFVGPQQRISEEEVDLSEKFMYNALESEDLSKAVSTVSRIIAEKNAVSSTITNALETLEANPVSIAINKSDAEHPANSAAELSDTMAQLSAFLSYFSAKTTSSDTEASNNFDVLAGGLSDMNNDQLTRTAKLVTGILKNTGPAESVQQNTVGLAESALLGLRSKIA